MGGLPLPDLGFAIGYIALMLGIGTALGAAAEIGSGLQPALVGAGSAALLGLHVAEHRAATLATVRRLRALDGPLLRGALVAIAVWLVTLPKPAANPFIYFRF